MKTYQMKAETRQIIGYIRNRLKENPDGLITWDELEAATGVYSRSRLRGYTMTARRHILNEDGFLIVAEHGVGIRRERRYDRYLDDTRRHIGRVARRANRAVPRAMEVDVDMSNDQREQALTRLAQVGALEYMANARVTKKLEAAARGQERKMMVGDVLKMFGKNGE